MDLFRTMQVFVTTVETGSMSAAASCLNLSPAMVGQYIAALENRLGTRLLNRTTRRQNLTDFGLSYLEQCKDILERIALADLAAESQHSEAQGKLRVSAPLTFGAAVLMPALKQYRQAAPLVKLDIVLTDRNVDLVEERFDIAFRIGNMPDSRLISRKLMPYQMVICASPDYLALKGRPLHPSELSQHELVSFTPTARKSWKLSQGTEIVDVTPECMMTVNSGHALLNAAKAGLGLVIQPRILLEPDISNGQLIQLLPEWSLGERHVSMLYYRDQHMTPRTRSFIEFALQAFDAKTHYE